MGRTRLERAIAKLKKEVNRYKHYKTRILDYLENLNNKHINEEITHQEYQQLLSQRFDGNTLQEWIDYYDFQIGRAHV